MPRSRFKHFRGKIVQHFRSRETARKYEKFREEMKSVVEDIQDNLEIEQQKRLQLILGTQESYQMNKSSSEKKVEDNVHRGNIISIQDDDFLCIDSSDTAFAPDFHVLQKCEGRWEFLKQIGSGCFGSVFLAKDRKTNSFVAVKMEKKKISTPLLKHEKEMYGKLERCKEGVGFPKIIAFETMTLGEEYHLLVMEKLGVSLGEVLSRHGGRFTNRMAFTVAIQLIERLKSMHTVGLVHRDIKPDNLLVGEGSKSNTLYLIDLGLAKEYREKGRPRRKQGYVGTPMFCSLAGNKALEQAPKDDLLSVGYLLIYTLKGLPWANVSNGAPDAINKRVANLKMSVPSKILFDGLPSECQVYFSKVKKLKFGEMPDHDFLKGIFQVGLQKRGLSEQEGFDS